MSHESQENISLTKPIGKRGLGLVREKMAHDIFMTTS